MIHAIHKYKKKLLRQVFKSNPYMHKRVIFLAEKGHKLKIWLQIEEILFYQMQHRLCDHIIGFMAC